MFDAAMRYVGANRYLYVIDIRVSVDGVNPDHCHRLDCENSNTGVEEVEEAIAVTYLEPLYKHINVDENRRTCANDFTAATCLRCARSTRFCCHSSSC